MSESAFARLVCAVGLLMTTALAPAAWAGTITFQDGEDNALLTAYAGTSDNTLLTGSNTARNSNYGGFTTFVVAGDKARRAILRFDLSSMAGRYDTIDSVTLNLSVASFSGAGTVSVYRIADDNAGWVEGVSGAHGALGTPNQGESTWNHLAFDSGGASTPWVGGGGLAATTPLGYDTPALGSFSYGARNAAGDVLSVSLPAAVVADWITGRNAGLLLRFDDEGPDNLIQFSSSEAAVSGGVNPRPALVIGYSVPEPGSLTLVGAAGLLLLWRRRPV